jgi:hypothetical protein
MVTRSVSFEVARFPPIQSLSCLGAVIPKGWSYVSLGDPSEWVPRRREGNERRETLGYELETTVNPNGVALTAVFLHD